MKVFYKKIQIISLLLSFILLLQSCVVYHKTAISFDQAVAANKRMKVITTENKKYKFRKIEKTDSMYHAITVVKGQRVKVPLNKNTIKSIHPINKTASTLVTIGTILIPLVALSAIVASVPVMEWESSPSVPQSNPY